MFGTRKTQIQPLLISTWNYTDANLQAWSVLQQGSRRTRQAVIQGCLACQSQRCGRLLAGGASPDANGTLTLEAAIMDGSTLRYGAVAGMEGGGSERNGEKADRRPKYRGPKGNRKAGRQGFMQFRPNN